MEAIREVLQHLRLGTEVTHENLTMFPLLNGGGRTRGYQTLREALAAGTLRITEVSEGGSVPQLSAVNDGDQPVIILDGEELVGAKQNRIANTTIIVPAKRTIPIPVSCVEAGRWGYRSRHFSDSLHTMYAEARAKKTRNVNESLRRSRGHDADQSDVWGEIDRKMRRLGADSPTAAMSDMYGRHRNVMDAYAGAFRPLEGQLGALFAINGRAVGFDLFDSAETLSRLLEKLVRSYALDALDHRTEPTSQSAGESALALLESAASANVEAYPAVGLGRELRLQGNDVVGAALEVDGRIVHITAFAGAAQNP
jgi:hypothetical protein